jgi:hypothetical protein
MQLSEVVSRFEGKYTTEPNSGCWLWTAALVGHGRYGTFWVDKDFWKGRMCGAHVASIFLFKGIRPEEGKHVLHKCDVSQCVNPDHLFIGTHKDNMRDMITKGRHNTPRVLTNDQVCAARHMRSLRYNVKDIAAIFGISRSHMSRVVAGVLPLYTQCYR